MVRLIFALLFVLNFLPGVAQTGPVLDINFPDPTVMKFNGVYYAYATNGNGKNIQVAVSKNLKEWKILEDALPIKPSWGNEDFWAPHVIYDAGINKYVLFYSAETVDTASGKALGVAYAERPEGPFTDKGAPLKTGRAFEEIDPFAYVDAASGKKYLIWGSGFEPLRIQEMNNDWSDFENGSAPKSLLYPNGEKQYTRLLEGSWIDYHKGFYYLYYSGDNCCGAKANYAVLVARSKNIDGPYQTMGEANKTNRSVILEKDENRIAPGHNSIVKDNKGKKWIVYHAIKKTAFDKGMRESRAMYINKIKYRKGWPQVIKN